MEPGTKRAPNTQFLGKEMLSASNDTVIRWMGAGAAMVNCYGTCIMTDPMLKDAKVSTLIDLPITAKQIPCLDDILVMHITVLYTYLRAREI